MANSGNLDETYAVKMRPLFTSMLFGTLRLRSRALRLTLLLR
jgi:hypothetical protein